MTKSVEFQVIPKLQEGETLVLSVEVGDMPTHLAMEYVENIKQSFMKTRKDADSVQYFFVPKHS